ncbi:MAG: ATP-dependent DNA ligase [Actinobacteria bacterium]|nr:ATP-dependent DNA ligase [Actinomycetota bacterium]
MSETDPDRLDRYRRMRDFSATPEPSGAPVGDPPDPDRPRFVIQQHDATRLHWDLRLEHDGVLLSFALPRGVPWNPDENRLAVHTEDHPIEYLGFHGEIPEGEYGAGEMTIWDRGTYEPEKIEDDGVTVTLHGTRVSGQYALFPIDGRDWMIHRKDPPQDPERRPLPEGLRPMRPVAGDLPDDGWGYEIRWVGARALLTNDAGHVTVEHEDEDVSSLFPEVRRIGRALGAVECVLDGVLVPVDRDRRPIVDRDVVRRRLDASSSSQVRRLSEDRPVAAVLFDLLWLEGHPTVDLPYEDRRQLLTELELSGPAWQTPRHHLGDGRPLLEAAAGQGLPGLVAKRLGSPYRPGAESDDWIEVDA